MRRTIEGVLSGMFEEQINLRREYNITRLNDVLNYIKGKRVTTAFTTYDNNQTLVTTVNNLINNVLTGL